MHLLDFSSSEDKRALLKGLLQTSGPTYDLADPDRTLDEMLVAARVFCLSNDERYFLDDPRELRRPLNHRNEAAALSLIQQRLSGVVTEKNMEIGKQLHEYCENLWPQFHHEDAGLDDREGEQSAGETTASFLSWAAKVGIESSDLVVGTFPPLGIRGVFSERDVGQGEDILSIPRRVLIYQDTVLETDLGKMLSVIPGLGMDNLLIVFTMIDRFDKESFWNPFWEELPEAFGTGLSFPEWVVELLKGSSAYDEIRQGQAHIRNQYESCRPLFDVLLTAYPTLLEDDWFTYERYVWSVELWYSYAFEIEFPPSTTSKTVMVPFACLVNHSPWPHCVRYGKLDVEADALRYPAFRPCRRGMQVFISYGPVPNVKLMTYYGFAVNDNPHDIVPLTLELPDGCSSKVHAVMAKYGLSLDHSLRPGDRPMSNKLQAAVRVLVATERELRSMMMGKMDPMRVIGADNEAQAIETLRVALRGVLEGIERAAARCREGAARAAEPWGLGVRMCQTYLEGQGRIVRDACVRL